MAAEKETTHGLARALSLLDYLSLYPHGISLADLARETQLPKSSLHRLLKDLLPTGYVTRSPEGMYSLSFKVCELSNRLLSGLDIVEISIPILKRLCDRVKETVHLVVPSGVDIVYLRKEDPVDSTIRIMSYTGMRRPMYVTAAGKSILSRYSDAQVKEIWDHSEILPLTDRTITRLPDLLNELDLTRRRGYALDDEENEIGIRCIGVPILNHMDVPIGAISVSAPANRMTPERIAELSATVRDAANSISFCMGYSLKRRDV